MNIEEYKKELENRELSKNTITKYIKDVSDFLSFVGDQGITQEGLINYKGQLLERYKVNTVNTKVTIINSYLALVDKDIKVKQERIQKSNSLDNVLSVKEFDRIIKRARTEGNERIRITMLSLYHTGLRVSELQYLTVEALRRNQIDVNNKGKHRRVAINKELTKELKEYIKNEGITEGPIIINRNGDPLSRSFIFREMKRVGGMTRGIKKTKIYPHSLRHLFALRWLKHNNNNMSTLADILGHSSLDTTRIYATLSTEEQSKTMDF